MGSAAHRIGLPRIKAVRDDLADRPQEEIREASSDMR
jgi:hypothetical protein